MYLWQHPFRLLLYQINRCMKQGYSAMALHNIEICVSRQAAYNQQQSDDWANLFRNRVYSPLVPMRILHASHRTLR